MATGPYLISKLLTAPPYQRKTKEKHYKLALLESKLPQCNIF